MVYLEVDGKYEEELKKQKVSYQEINGQLYISKDILQRKFNTIDNILNLKSVRFDRFYYEYELKNLNYTHKRSQDTLDLLKRMKYKQDREKYDKLIGRQSRTGLMPGGILIRSQGVLEES